MTWRQIIHLFDLPMRPELAPVHASASHWMLFSLSEEPKETVSVQRRRRPTSSGERERADTPTRDKRDEVSAPPPPPPRPPQGSGKPPSSGGQRPKGGMKLGGLVLLLVLFLCIGAFSLFNRGGSDNAASAPPTATTAAVAENQVQSESSATAKPLPASMRVGSAGEHKEWLIMLYQDADDKILEEDIFVDFNEAERAGSGDQLHVVSQIDRYQSGYSGDGNWQGAKRFYVTADGDLGATGSIEVDDLGEVNMADGDTLVDFVTWAVDRYPADKHVLILSDHGMGWPGGWTDPTAGRGGGGGSPMEQRMSDQLFLHELDEALTKIRAETGIDKFELIGMDACLMAHLEVFSALEPHARYAVASQETEPAVGWAYMSFLDSLAQNPDADGADLGRLIVDSYIQDDQRILDDDARAAMVGRGRGVPSARQLSQQLEANVTLSAVDLAALPALMDGLNDLAFALQETNLKPVSQARSYAQSYTSVFGNAVPPSYIDLGNFAEMLAGSLRGDASLAVQAVQNALDDTVIAERHGTGKQGSNGISIYFPNSDLYRNPVSGNQSYGAIAERFAQESLWDDFLNFYYTGSGFERGAVTAALPETSQAIRRPASGEITVSPVEASSQSVAPGETVNLSVDIAGDNIGYVKLLAGFYDEGSNSIYVADMDYLESADTREIDGVYYPVWPEDEFTMEFDWEPIVFAVDDGEIRAPAVFAPESYGGTYEEALYMVSGIYTYADGETRPAQMQFRNGALEQVFGFTGQEEAGAPREILPQLGDTFTVQEQWLELDTDGNVRNVVYEEGKTITFGSAPITWETLDAAAGDYIVGFVIEDLDGKQYPVFTEIVVE